MKTTIAKKVFITLLLPVALLLGACSDDDSCNIALLSFNNHLSDKIKVQVNELSGTAVIEPGSSTTVEVEPNNTYHYTIREYFSGSILGSGEVFVKDCVSMGVDIK